MRSNHPIETVRDVQVELKALRLHGMASAWGDLMEQGGASIVCVRLSHLDFGVAAVGFIQLL